MKLTNFEGYIDDTILKRGKDYFVKGLVEDVALVERGHYSALVSGSEDYQVDIIISDHGDIIDSFCDCPYDFGEFCKHQVAVFYTLNDGQSKPKEKKKIKTVNLTDILEGLKKEELVGIILTITENDRHIEKQLMMKYGPTEDEVKSSKKFIKEYINSAKKRGFIEWNKVAQAVKGAEVVLDKAITHLENKHPKMAVNLTIVILSEMTNMIEYCDDSNGYVGEVIHGSLDLIKDATEEGRNLPLSQQEEMFQTILKEARHPQYDGWHEWSHSLIRSCISLCDNPILRKKLETEVQKMIDDLKEDSWSTNYNKEELMLIRLEVMEQFYSAEQVDQFIFNNISIHKFREKAISRLFEGKKYEEITGLCLEGEQKDAEYRGIVHKWKEYRYQAYEGQRDIAKQKQLGKELLLKGEYSYYHKLKALYSVDKWEVELNDILSIFEDSHRAETYVKILIEEKLTEKLLSYCNRDLYEIARLYPYLIDEYPSDVAKLFTDYIRQYSEQSSNRKEYKKVCKVIKTFKKVCGSVPAGHLIKELEEKYLRRPAFLDELKKVN